MDWESKRECRSRASAKRRRSLRRRSITVWRRATRRLLEDLDDLVPGHHVDRVVVRRAAELALLRRGGVAERDAQSAADAQVRAHCAHHPAVAIGLLDDTTGHGTRRLADRAGERTEAAIGVDDRNRLRGLLARPGHHLGPHRLTRL